MPAIIAHDLFAKDLYGELFESIGGSRDEAEAFLLGSQGPDPLFFGVADPRYLRYASAGSALHRKDPAAFLLALKGAVGTLAAREQSTGRAFVLGMTAHYAFDRTLHPFIYAQEIALCHAGVEGLDEGDRPEVHAAIETELDELVLTAKRNETVADFQPAATVLKGTDEMLAVASILMSRASEAIFDAPLPLMMYKDSVYAARAVQNLVYSPRGVKRAALGALERMFRHHSMLSALSHRDELRYRSGFANHDRNRWTDPFTGDESTADFWDLYERALDRARAAIGAVDADGFDRKAAEELTEGFTFHGEPTRIVLISVEDADAPANESR